MLDSISMSAIIFLCAYVALAQLDAISIQIGPYSPLFAGTVTGLVLGDLNTGLMVGGTLQLMTLGVATYGGASVPDFLSGAIMGTAYAIISRQGPEYGIALAVPIGILLTQLDILGRMCNTYFQHRADRCALTGDYKGVESSNLLGILPWTVSRIIPVFIGLYFGEPVVKAITNHMPAWFILGLKTAGGLLPALGIAILMKYLPMKKFYPFYIIGFVTMAYGGANFSIVGVALLGTAFAGIYVMFKKEFSGVGGNVGASGATEVEIDD